MAPEPGNIPELLNWDLFLSGGLLCTPQFFIDSVGAAAEFKAAVSRGGKRYVWLSDRFQREHADKCASIRRAMRLPCSVWTEVNRHEWVDHAAMTAIANKNLLAIGIVIASDAPQVQGERNLFSPQGLYSQFLTLSSSFGDGDH